MKRAIFALLVTLSLLSVNAYGMDIKLATMRSKIFNESGEIKALLSPKSQDAAIITSLYGTCITTVMQLDAYFNMIGIFNSVKREDWGEDSLKYLLNWLDELKKTNELNVGSLASLPAKLDEATRTHALKIKAYFGELSKAVDVEISRLSQIKPTLKKAKGK